MILYDVLYAPEFQYNLLFFTKLSKTVNCELVFSSNGCLIQEILSNKKIGSARICNGLYHLDISTGNRNNSRIVYVFYFVNNIVACNENALWHYRLGHISNAKLLIIHKSFPNDTVPFDFSCDICHLSEQKKLSFNASTSTSTTILILFILTYGDPLLLLWMVLGIS